MTENENEQTLAAIRNAAPLGAYRIVMSGTHEGRQVRVVGYPKDPAVSGRVVQCVVPKYSKDCTPMLVWIRIDRLQDDPFPIPRIDDRGEPKIPEIGSRVRSSSPSASGDGMVLGVQLNYHGGRALVYFQSGKSSGDRLWVRLDMLTPAPPQPDTPTTDETRKPGDPNPAQLLAVADWIDERYPTTDTPPEIVQAANTLRDLARVEDAKRRADAKIEKYAELYHQAGDAYRTEPRPWESVPPDIQNRIRRGIALVVATVENDVRAEAVE